SVVTGSRAAMSAAGGSHRSTVAAAARWSATALLAGALALGGSPALANPEPVPVDPQGGAPAQPGDPGVDPAAPPVDEGTTEPAPAPAPVSPSPTATGYVPNGNAGGPAVFSPVPADPAVV